MRSFLPCLPLLLAASLLPACSSAEDDWVEGSDDAITSNDANILDFKFEAEVIAAPNAKPRQAIVAQLMYAQGILTTNFHGNGKVGQVTLTDVSETPEGAKKRIKYKASLPVAFPKDQEIPTSYELLLPKDGTRFDAFNAKYDGSCGRSEYGQDTFWHDWNPKTPGCNVDPADVSRANATVARHALETQKKYPEYDQIWADDRLDVVAIFGIISSNTPSDWGYGEAQRFVENTRSRVSGASITDNAPSASILKDQTITGKVTVGGRERDVKVDVLVVEELQHVGADFDTRYDALTAKADMIMYNGHAGLGKNVNALAKKGTVTAGKYQLVLLNGCQTFAYIETTLNDRRIDANGAANDPNGTKYLDVVANALPGWANNLASMSNTLFDAVVRSDQPKHYNDLLATMPESHIVVVFGEEDNRFAP